MAKRPEEDAPGLQGGVEVQPDHKMGAIGPFMARLVMTAFDNPMVPGMNVPGQDGVGICTELPAASPGAQPRPQRPPPMSQP